MSTLSTLEERGFVAQVTKRNELAPWLADDRRSRRFYVGFDPTASSLHIGSLVPIMAMAHLQQAGHHPIVIIGGGTALVGDPSGKTSERQLLDRQTITKNGDRISAQIGRYLTLDGQSGQVLNNADWLTKLGYIEFIRDIGRHFRVNDMLRAEAYRARLEREAGLSFLEFSYMLLQAYDFYVLAKDHDCFLQIGGDDQWSNILAGCDLIRKLLRQDAFGLTLPLLTTARGQKMGKTEAGPVWLDADLTSPYDFYQYWVNVDDRDVRRFLALFTFLPMPEVERLGALSGADLRQTKHVLAFEATKLAHSEAAAKQAQAAAVALFADGDRSDTMPTTTISAGEWGNGLTAADLFRRSGLAASGNAARRLIEQGGAYINQVRVTDPEREIRPDDVSSDGLLLRAGKKSYRRIILS